MTVVEVKHIPHLCCIVLAFLALNTTWGSDVCPGTTDGQLSWPTACKSECVPSNPVCLNENMVTLSRCCGSDGKWKDAPICWNYQDTIINPCPDNFDVKNNICIFIIENSRYPPQCPYEETLPFHQYISVLNAQLFPIWMPVKRIIGDYGMDVLRWMEPTSTYKAPFASCDLAMCNNDYYYKGSIKNKNCLIYHNSSFIEAVSCEEKHTAICAYQTLPQRVKSFCSQSLSQHNPCVQSNYSSHSKCFCRGLMKDYSLAPRVEFHEPYQNFLYSSLNDMCYIGLENLKGSYLWRNSNTTLKYSNWAKEAVFDENHRYGALTPNGWVMAQTENETDCVLYETEIPISKSEIVLDYTVAEQFILKLTNPNAWVMNESASMPMVFCFTDAVSNALVSRMYPTRSALLVDEVQFYFERHFDGPGTYWCEAFVYPDVVAKTSNKYLLRYNDSYTEEYVVILNTSYSIETNPITETNIQRYQKMLADQIKSTSELSNFQVRIFKIEIDDDSLQLTLNFHVANPVHSEPLVNYGTLRGYVESSLINFTFVKILGVDRCVGIQTSPSVTWPVTPISTSVRPREGYCVSSSGLIVNRHCLGSYIDGADWSDLLEPCTIQQSTNATINLTNIVYQGNSQEYMDQVVEIVKDNKELSARDVELVSYFLVQVGFSENIDIDSVKMITSHLMELPQSVLEESQNLAMATDRIIHNVQTIIKKSKFSGQIDGENLIIISHYIKDCNLNAITIQDTGTHYNIDKKCNMFNTSEILEIQDLKAALILNDNVMDKFKEEAGPDSRIIITIYKNSNLFNELNRVKKNTDLIIGVTFPETTEEFSEEIYTVYSIPESEENYMTCSYWDYRPDKKAGYWAEAERRSLNTSVVCTYDSPTYFTIVRNEEVNITHELETLLHADLDLSEKLKEAHILLTNFYMSFQPVDLDLMSRLLHTAAEVDEDNLDLVADIINIIVDIPKEVLEKSQEAYNATGKILLYFDQMLQNCNSWKIIDKDNFYAIVHFLKEDGDFYGFIINHCDTECKITLLNEETTAEKISLTEKMDTALLISRKMLDQLLSYNKDNFIPKIVSAVFFKDSLFIDDSTKSKISTKIVGVSFPHLEDLQLNGDLKVLYNLNLDITTNYSTCSVYQSNTAESTIERGFWNSGNPVDSVNGMKLCTFWQPEYFALMYNLANLTSSLESMLNSNEDMEIILERISSITRNYKEHLQPIDIFIIAQLFSKIVQINEVMLEIYVNIINDIMQIPLTILRSSQEDYNATSIILHTFDYVAETYTATKEIYTDNVALIVSLLSETNMYGVKLENCIQYCNVTILYNQSKFYQDVPLNTFDVNVELSANLIKNLLAARNDNYNPRLVLKIFYNNVLFIEGDSSRETSQVFGIHFPDFERALSSEITITFQLPSGKVANYYNCVSWRIVQNQEVWLYESRPRTNESLTCNFYEGGYFSLVEGNTSFDNVSQELDNIVNSNISSLAMLFKAQDISYYYMDFQPYDIYLFSLILMQCIELSNDGLDMVNILINNILRTPKEILLESSETFDSLRQILMGINHISNYEESRQYSLLNDQFGLVVCQLRLDSSNGVILTTDDIKCTYQVDEADFAYAEHIIASILISKEIAAQTAQACDNPKIIVSVFSNNLFFNNDEIQNNSIVLGVSIPSIQRTLEGTIDVLFNKSVYENNNYGCGYWESLNEWKVQEGKIKNSLIKCGFSEATYYTLLQSSNDNNKTTDVTEILEVIINSNDTTLSRLNQTLEVMSKHSNQIQSNHVYLISKILSFVNEVDSKCLEATINIISLVMNLPREILLESQVKYNATDWLLYHLNRIAENIEGEGRIENENLTVVFANNISGIFVGECFNTCNIGIIYDNVNLTTLAEDLNVSIAVILDDTLREKIQSNHSFQVVVTVYYKGVLFNEVNEPTYENIGPVIGVVIPSQSEALGGYLRFYYYTEGSHSSVCAFWDYTVEEDPIIKGHWEIDEGPFESSQFSLCKSQQSTHFSLVQNQKNVTSDLEDILNSESTVVEKLDEVVFILSDLVNKLGPVDIYLISKILELALEEIDAQKMNITSHIISNLFNVPRNVLRESQLTYYATDKILHAIEEMTKKLNAVDVEPIVRDNFTVAIYDLKQTNISGLLLQNCNTSQCDISTLEGNVNLTDIVKDEYLQTAITLSDDLLNQIRQAEGSPKLVVTIYFSDVFFNEQSERDGNVSMVCGVLLPGFNETFLGNVYVMFNNADTRVDYNSSCAFWNFKVHQGEEIIKGSWKSEVEPRSKDNFTICEYDHITHFALLLARDNSSFAEGNINKVLDIITAVSSILSIIGIFGILLTAALFERWRRNTGNQILVHFSVAISIKMVMLYVSVGVYTDKPREIVCSVTGAILHYAILSEFCWMLIIAILQFKRFVEVLGGPPKFVLLKACICGWLFPILPVTLILLVDKENYNEGNVGLCYPSGLGLYLGIWLPLIIIVTINFVIFIFIIYNVFHKKTETRDLVNHEILFQWRLALLLFSMLGLTWLFGFMAQIPGAESIFVYLFCISATLQGFIMFLFFIVFNKSTRFLYSQAIKLWLYSRGYKMQ